MTLHLSWKSLVMRPAGREALVFCFALLFFCLFVFLSILYRIECGGAHS